jgi:pimeloyl-ACP methyl ester carboxylesterase
MKKILPIVAVGTIFLLAGCIGPQHTPEKDKSHFASFGTNEVHYVVEGKGPHAIVFIHGWACNAGFWREQVPALAGRARLILIDLPGHGQSDKPQTDYTMDYFARAVLAVMRDAHVQKATLVGHSMGAPVICRVYAQAPEKVAALVAVDGLLRRPKMQPEQVEQFVGPYRTPDYRQHATRFIDSMFPNPGSEALRDRVREEMLMTPQHVMRGAMDNMFSSNQSAWDLAKVNVPVLVINAKSPMWTSEYEAYVRSLSPQTDYRVIDGPGHFLMLEKPAQFNAALANMLKRFDLIGD